jgi:outer membrane receptor for ferrienterochelin and colicin
MNYKVKCLVKAPEYDDKGKRTHAGTLLDGYYGMKDFQEIFLVDFEKDQIKLNFKSPLGKMILHNTLILDTDWVPDEALTLSKNAYFIYKRFVLNRVSGKNKPKELELWFEDIKNFLDLNWSNNGGIYPIIDKAFKEMQQKGMIAGYSWNKNAKQRQYRVSF